VDNVIRNGGVIDASSTDPNIIGVRQFNEMLAVESRVTATTIQTVGAKGYDGMTFVLVN
jgi:predicted O-methyltransferase YrrM